MAKPGNTKGVIRLFDARPDCLDCRDLPYRPPLRSLPPKYPLEPDVEHLIGEYVGAGLILDQGSEGAGTGFGLAGVANCLLWTRHIEDPVKVPFPPVSPRMCYELAKRYDEWPARSTTTSPSSPKPSSGSGRGLELLRRVLPVPEREVHRAGA